jgi:uncharacterized integral membrane protein
MTEELGLSLPVLRPRTTRGPIIIIIIIILLLLLLLLLLLGNIARVDALCTQGYPASHDVR